MFSVVDSFHSNSNEDCSNISVNDLANLVFASVSKDHPYYQGILQQLETLDVSDSSTKVLVKKLCQNEKLKNISLAAYEVTEGRKTAEELDSLLSDYQNIPEQSDTEADDFVTDDLELVIARSFTKPGLKWRLGALNRMLGSLRSGDFGFIFARPECISGDTVIRIKHNKEGTSSKKYKLSAFYKLFNGNHHLKGVGHQIQASTPDGRVYYTDVEHVSYSGKKVVYSVTTRRGFTLLATSDHEFLMATGEYKQLQDLYLGSEIRSDRTHKAPRRDRSERMGKWPTSPYSTRMVDRYGPYNRAKEHRLSYDAHLNKLSLEEFVKCLNEGTTEGFVYSDSSLDIHHKDMDHNNNDPSNLTLVTRAEHSRLHCLAGDVGNSKFADVDWVESIKYVGEQDVYDIGVSGENKNFRADGIYVHNCGKTTLLASEVSFMAEQVPEESGPIIWLANEEEADKIVMRVYQAAFGITLANLQSDPVYWREEYRKLTKGKLKLIKDTSANKTYIERLCKKYNPAMLIIDQLSKVSGFDADRKDLELGQATEWARGLAKQGRPVVAVHQADGTAEGVKWLTMGHVANAKTSMQADADWILGLGKSNDVGYESLRYLALSKNKLIGDADVTDPALRHGRVEVLLEASVARYRDL